MKTNLVKSTFKKLAKNSYHQISRCRRKFRSGIDLEKAYPKSTITLSGNKEYYVSATRSYTFFYSR